MPTTIFLRGGVRFELKGDGPGTIIKRLFNPMATGIAMNGHLVDFRWRERLFIEPQPEAEYRGRLAEEAKRAEEQAKAQAEAQARAEKDKDAALKVAAEAFIKKTWMVKAKVEVKVKPVVVLTTAELVLFLLNEREFSGLIRAIGRSEEERKILWRKTGAKYGFDAAPRDHVLNLETGEITKAF